VSGKAAILYITHNRLWFSRLTLPHLLESGGYEDYSVTVVDNASTDGTREWLASLSHPRLAGVSLNDSNLPLRDVTNRFWASNSGAEFVGKVDDDTLMPVGFVGQAARILGNPVKIGAVGAMHFDPLDVASVDASAYMHNLRRLPNGRRVLLQRHLGGCCYLMRCGIVAELGPMESAGYLKGGWTEYQWRALKGGYAHAYLYPFMFAKHFDDPDFLLSVSVSGGRLPQKLAQAPAAMFRAKERIDARKLLTGSDTAAMLESCKIR
jgi:GT2 family glycosyltransferase